MKEYEKLSKLIARPIDLNNVKVKFKDKQTPLSTIANTDGGKDALAYM